MVWLWLIVRVYVGYQWLTAGFEKLTGYSITVGNTFGTKAGSSWIFTSHLGAALQGFAQSGIAQAAGAHPGVQGWYAWFLQNVVIPGSGFFAYVVTFGEVLVGLGLILGVLTGIAAFFGVFMNMNFLLAGAVFNKPTTRELTHHPFSSRWQTSQVAAYTWRVTRLETLRTVST